MKVGHSGLITFAAFFLVFWGMTQARTGDVLVRSVIWAAVLLLSAYVLVRLWRVGAHGTDYTAALPPGVRRWLLGESDTPR
jgi:hypothetical protein